MTKNWEDLYTYKEFPRRSHGTSVMRDRDDILVLVELQAACLRLKRAGGPRTLAGTIPHKRASFPSAHCDIKYFTVQKLQHPKDFW